MIPPPLSNLINNIKTIYLATADLGSYLNEQLFQLFAKVIVTLVS
jgi:hypothetical protein